MNAKQVVLVKESFEKVRPIAEVAADIFYKRLFELDPKLRALFTGDMKEQGRKLMQSLALVVANLERPEAIVPTVQEMGRKHVGYGVQPADYQTVGSAFLWTLEQGLGAAFTGEVKDAWAAAYNLLSSVMLDAAVQMPQAVPSPLKSSLR